MVNIFTKILKISKNNRKILLPANDKTYEDFFILSHKYFNFLKNRIKPGQIVCICSGYSIDFLAIIFACYLNKNTINILNIKSSTLEKKKQIENSKSKLVIFDAKDKFLFKKYQKFENFYFKKMKNNYIFKNKIPCFLIYTSGTSSEPKGVMISSKALSNNVYAINKDLSFNKMDRFLIFSPPNYAMGISQIFSALYAQGEIFFYNNGLKFPSELLKIILYKKITILNLSISAFRILKNFIQKKILFTRIVMSGGMQYTYNDYTDIKKIFPKSKLVNFYGCTENSPRVSHCHLKSSLLSENIFPVGKPLKGIKVKILKFRKEKKGIGKILISGSSLMDGYFRFKLSKKNFYKGWYVTGDIGFFKNGQLYLIGREDNTFSVGHEKLCPEEIEALLKRKFNFNEIVVSKTKDKILNYRPKYYIEMSKKKISKNKIYDYIYKNLSSFKIPKEIVFLKKIPRTKYGKVNRKALH